PRPPGGGRPRARTPPARLHAGIRRRLLLQHPPEPLRVRGALGRPEGLAAVLGPPAVGLLDDRPRPEPGAEPRAHALGHADADGRRVVLPGALRLRDRSVRAHARTGHRGPRPEPTPPELLDDDPPAVALSRLRERVGAVRLRRRRARDRPARRPVDPDDASL